MNISHMILLTIFLMLAYNTQAQAQFSQNSKHNKMIFSEIQKMDSTKSSNFPSWSYEPFIGFRIAHTTETKTPVIIGGNIRKLYRNFRWIGLNAGAFYFIHGSGSGNKMSFQIDFDLMIFPFKYRMSTTPFIVFGAGHYWRKKGYDSYNIAHVGIGFEQKIGNKISIPIGVYSSAWKPSEIIHSYGYVKIGLCVLCF